MACLLLCNTSRKLYNSALYAFRQQYFKNKTCLSYETLAKQFKYNIHYCDLPAKVSQQTLKLLSQNISSFFALTKSENLAKLEDSYLAQFYDEDFVIEIVYSPEVSTKRLTNQSVKLIEEKIITKKFNKKLNIEEKGEKIVHNLEGDFSNFASIDMNLNALAVATANQSFLFSLKPVKSKNHFWNKKCAEIQSKIDKLEQEIDYLNSDLYQIHHQFSVDYHSTFLSEESLKDFIEYKQQEKENKLKNNKQIIRKLKKQRKHKTQYRNNYIENFVHQLTCQLVRQLDSLEIQNVIFGKNVNLKHEINLGKKLNQQFVQIPFNKIIQKLSYKAQLNGMNFMTVEESYTSKTSFLDKETLYSYKKNKPKKNYVFFGQRFERSLFRSNKGKVIHADINGAYNIARKVIGEEIYQMVNLASVMGSPLKKVNVKLN